MRNIYVPIIQLFKVRDDGLRPSRSIYTPPPSGPSSGSRTGTIFNKYVIRGAKQ
jgi:hypothetical protein